MEEIDLILFSYTSESVKSILWMKKCVILFRKNSLFREYILLKIFSLRISISFYFQVCVFSKTACFGLGENMTNRRIIAMKNVLCLRIPKYWLQIHNPGNVWGKIIHYMNNCIPSTKQVFKKYCHEKKWERFKNDLVNKITNKTPSINWYQIPYSIRINRAD